MIEINFEELALIVITGLFLLLGLLLLVHSSRDRRYRRKRSLQIIQCPVCGEVFDERGSEKIPICIGCGRKTLRGNDKSLG